MSSWANTTGIVTVMVAPRPTRTKSTCSGSSVTGCSWTSRGSTRTASPFT